mmetsp:Transcript_154/g.467  ORF Transcript_154/g.467 Transcript_154/m.467 type:complete len:824 (+) Transcript_154:789-3260(+)
MALSFADASGCKKVWEVISRVQGASTLEEGDHCAYSKGYLAGYEENDVNGDDVPFRSYTNEALMENSFLTDDGRSGTAHSFFSSLPSVERGTLEMIAQTINDNTTVGSAKDKVLAEVSAGGKYAYVESLLDVFHKCEDLGDVEGLQILYRIFRGLFLLGDADLLKNLLSEERIMDVVGVLEYDPECYSTSLSNGEVLLNRHREFLRSKVAFREVVPIHDESIVAQIHQNYRISYLMDVILPRALDDGTYAALSHIIFKNNNDIVLHFLGDRDALAQLFARLTADDEKSRASRRNDLKFLVELCSLTKSPMCLAANRERFHSMLIELGLFDVCSTALKDPNVDIQSLGSDMLSTALMQNQGSVRSHILSQPPTESLLSVLVDKMSAETDSGILLQVFEILRTLLDPDSITLETEKNNFLNLFYDRFVQRLVPPLQKEEPRQNSRMLKSYICDFFSACVASHGYRPKFFIIGNNVVAKVLTLLKTDSSYVAVSALRFFRACVGVKDDFYNKYIIKNRLLGPIAKVYRENADKDNLLNSAVLELVQFLTRENVKDLLADLVENYSADFDVDGKNGIFAEARKVHTKNTKTDAAASSLHLNGDGSESANLRRLCSWSSSAKPAPDLDEDEAYFESDDGEDMADQPLIGPSPPSSQEAPAENAAAAHDTSSLDAGRAAADEGAPAKQSAARGGEMGVSASSSDKPVDAHRSAEDRGDSVTDSTNVKSLVDYPIDDDDEADDEVAGGERKHPSGTHLSLKMESGQVSVSGAVPSSGAEDKPEGQEESSGEVQEDDDDEQSPLTPPEQKRRRKEQDSADVTREDQSPGTT